MTDQPIELLIDTAVALAPAATNGDAASALMSMIGGVIKEPSFNVEALDKLMALYERSRDHDAKSAYYAALSTMQPKLPIIDRKGRITVYSKADRERPGGPSDDAVPIQSTPYARWEDINKAVTPILAEHGFALSFRTGSAPDGKVEVTGILSHRAGHQEEAKIALMLDTTGSKNNVQAVGSSLSYGKRYTATFLLNITSEGEDDDGQAAAGNEWIDEKAMDDLVALMDEVKADRQKFLDWLKVDTLAHLPKKRLPDAIKALEKKREAA